MSGVAQGKSAQVRLRATESEKALLEDNALEAGFVKKDGTANLSEYLRKVLLESHVLIVKPGEDLLLLPGTFSTPEAREDVENTVRRVLEVVNNPSASGIAPSPLPPEPGEGGGAAGELERAAAAPPASETSPTSPAEDSVVGTSASHTPSGETPAVEPVQCPNCGQLYPPGTHEPGGEACNLAIATVVAQRDGEVPVEAPDANPLTEAELDPENGLAPIGPPQPGENEVVFLTRRVAELERDGRPSLIARAEAGGEWRAALGAPPPVPASAPSSPPAATQAAATAPCGRCGATVAVGQPCPECGLRPAT